MKNITFREFAGKGRDEHLKKRLQEMLDNKVGGFVSVFNGATNTLTDDYFQMCRECVEERARFTIEDAQKEGLLVRHDKY